ncbi:MAG: hypothetical protein HN995_13395 [Candidatus Marinimicrobia bacterium]|jgi:hypothetical protein|nr:hypothetical protein [Candidatus Neomarinimicrobiota bacterium]MBT3576198.1 hypothetical protein [Candidatus Neomarinimicrobiota bacterium]MBT3679233.1 hypothetical protein [Candidatus Neomarinimicrobiota bacterium]MBT3949727.1 hypothetical protein [Candidatus Neomarinimicrobiota bacterium]MBT4254059.1 hypothetical protein [Candidatus Neomarinimicrobiota bacterium]
MLNMNGNNIIRSILLIVVMLSPLVVLSQSKDSDVRALHREIDKLSEMVTKLKAEQAKSYSIEAEIKSPNGDFTKRDSLRLVRLKKKQAESRVRIDQITLDILKISKQLEDPGKRYALAKRMQQPKLSQKVASPGETPDSTEALLVVSARSIDLASVKLVREGKSLDQARLLTIDALSDEQVLVFYQNLDKDARYELYDIADEIVRSDKIELVDARRSAIYFYLFTK